MLGALMVVLLSSLVLAETVRIYPTADAFVRTKQSNLSEANTNFGTSPNLNIGFNVNFGTERSYLKFDLSSLNGAEITSATFSFDRLASQDNPTINLYTTSNSWNEGTITWNNKPAESTLINSVVVTNQDRVSYDVTSFVNTGQFSFALIEGGENAYVTSFSKDLDTGNEGDEVNWPYINVVYEGDAQQCNTEADADCNGDVSLTEYNDFKYGFKNGLLPNITLTEYNDIKYAFKNGLLN